MLDGAMTTARAYSPPMADHLRLPSTVEPVTCASIGSIYLEHQRLETFHDLAIDVLDMECASVFAAAKAIQRPAAAVMYVTDIVGKDSPYDITDSQTVHLIEQAQNSLAELLLAVIGTET